MSIEGWLYIVIIMAGGLSLFGAGLIDASLTRRQRWTLRELLETGAGGGGPDSAVEQNGELRQAADAAGLLSALVIGVAITHVTIANLSTLWLLVTVPTTLIAALMAGRVLPAALVDRYDLAEAGWVQRLAVLTAVLMGPVLLLVQMVDGIMNRAQQHEPDGSHLVGQDTGDTTAETTTNGGSEPGSIEHDEHVMISGILGLEEAFAREIMVPRPDMVAVAVTTPVPDIVRVAQDAGHSRIPVYLDSIDRIQGIVYAKDLLRFVHDDASTVDVQELMRPALFVPESKRVDDLLRDLQRARVHLAIVVDEYGGTAGLVTIEDIIEEIVGEIQDEYDRESPLYQFGPEGEVTVEGRMSVDELTELTGQPVPETESETVGGLVVRELGHIPEPGESVRVGPLWLTVESVERRRVRRVQVMPASEDTAVNAASAARVP